MTILKPTIQINSSLQRATTFDQPPMTARRQGVTGVAAAALRVNGKRERVLPSNTDPTSLASRIAQGMHAGARCMIEACVLLSEGLQYYEGDALLKDQFTAALVEAHVIPRRSARLGAVEKSKLSMLRKIGENDHLLLDDSIFRFLEPGRSILYHVVRLYEELPGNHELRMTKLVEFFEAQGGLTRDFLIEQIRLAMRASHPDLPPAAEPWASDETEQPFDLILLTPSRRADLRRLDEDYADRPPLCLRTHQRVSPQAVALVIARLVELPTIVNKLLPGCGFANISRVLLLRNPPDADVTDAPVLVIAVRGAGHEDIAPFDWLSDEQQLNARSLAARLVPSAVNRLQLFAADHSDGWSSVIGEANWS